MRELPPFLSVRDVVFLGRDAINPGAHGRGACLSGW
jgi:hypothetical protein